MKKKKKRRNRIPAREARIYHEVHPSNGKTWCGRILTEAGIRLRSDGSHDRLCVRCKKKREKYEARKLKRAVDIDPYKVARGE